MSEQQEGFSIPLSPCRPFQYGVADWQAIETAIEHLPNFGRALGAARTERFATDATLVDVMRHWLQIAAADYLATRNAATPAPAEARTAFAENVVDGIDELADRILVFSQATFGGQVLQPDIGEDLQESRRSLEGMRAFFLDLQDALSRSGSVVHNGCGFAPVEAARGVYFRAVLDVWMQLGGELKISRHPVSGEVGGPLARFFFAVVVPVMGNDVPSASSLPRIVRSCREAVNVRSPREV